MSVDDGHQLKCVKHCISVHQCSTPSLTWMQPSAPTQVCSLPLCLSAALLPCQLSFSHLLRQPPNQTYACVALSGCLTLEGTVGQHSGE